MFQVRAKHLFFNTNHILTSPALQPRKHLRSPCFPYTFPVVCLLHLEFQGASRDATWNECTTGGDLQHARGLAAVSFEDIVFRIWMNHGIMAWYSQLHWASESHHLDSLLLVICSMLFALCHQPTVSARSGRNPAVRECSDLPQEFQIWLRQWLAWRYLLGLTFMVSSSFDIGLEKESSKHLNREREREQERDWVYPSPIFFMKYTIPGIHTLTPMIRLSFIIQCRGWHLGFQFFCSLAKNAWVEHAPSTVTHHRSLMGTIDKLRQPAEPSRMGKWSVAWRDVSFLKYFCIYVSILRYTQHVDFKGQDTKTSCTDIFDGFWLTLQRTQGGAERVVLIS